MVLPTTALLEISRRNLPTHLETRNARITEVKHLASYNWIEARRPTIAVPGCPRVWSNVKTRKKLPKDSGHIYINQNEARNPESALEPLFRALYVEHPDYNIRDTDLVSDRNNVRKLLSFVDPSTSRNGLEPFTIKAEVVGNTVLLKRHDTKFEEFIGPAEFKGFGHEFEKAYTTDQIDDSTGHHRIISYRFSNLSMIIRHETDGYVDEPGGLDRSLRTDDVLDMMNKLSLHPESGLTEKNTSCSKLIVKKEGHKIPIASTIEIKTRVAHMPMSFDDAAPQLWISQTPKLVRAYHERGIFGVPVVEDIETNLVQWEERNLAVLTKLGFLLRKVLETARAHGRVSIHYDRIQEKLCVTPARTAANMLPEDIYLNWANPSTPKPIQAEPDVPSSDPRPVSPEKSIRIGHDIYKVPLHKLPYLESIVETQRLDPSAGAHIGHDWIDLFDVALEGVVSGFRHCLRSLDSDVSIFRRLCKTYDLLQVDVLAGQTLGDLFLNIKAGKADYEAETKPNKTLARDSAFQLVYLMLCSNPTNDIRDRDKLYNAVLYILSHHATFKFRTRSTVRAVYDTLSLCSAKQASRLDEWRKQEDNQDDGETTPSPDLFYDSSDGYWS